MLGNFRTTIAELRMTRAQLNMLTQAINSSTNAIRITDIQGRLLIRTRLLNVQNKCLA